MRTNTRINKTWIRANFRPSDACFLLNTGQVLVIFLCIGWPYERTILRFLWNWRKKKVVQRHIFVKNGFFFSFRRGNRLLRAYFVTFENHVYAKVCWCNIVRVIVAVFCFHLRTEKWAVFFLSLVWKFSALLYLCMVTRCVNATRYELNYFLASYLLQACFIASPNIRNYLFFEFFSVQ